MATLTLTPIKDTHIANHSRWNYYVFQSGKMGNLSLGSWDWSYQPYYNFFAYQSRMLLQYALPQLPVGAVITGAKLKMWLVKEQSMHSWNNGYYNYADNHTINVHKVTSSWGEGTGDGNSYGYQYTGATWTSSGNYGYWPSGGSYDYTASASVTGPWADHQWEFDVLSLVQSWYSTPSSNYGLMVKIQDDYIARGELWTGSRESGWAPTLEITYNTPPEKPRGLVPNFDSFVCYDLSHTTHFKWNFIDTAAPVNGGKSDVVFLVDVSASMSWMLPTVRQEIANYIDRLNGATVDWKVGLVAFSDVHIGEPLRKWGWFTDKNSVLTTYDNMPRLYGGDYPESGLEAIEDPINGALSFPFRSDAKVHLVIATDAPFHNADGIDTGYYYRGYSSYHFNNVVQDLKNRGIICSVCTNTHCTAYTQLVTLPRETGGSYYDESSGWGNYVKIFSQPFEDESKKFDEGDYQSRADLRVFKIMPDGSRSQIWSYTVSGGQQELETKSLGIPWEEGGSYEWDVMCYDSSGLTSPWSDRAKMTYVIDVSAQIGIPMYNEPITVGDTINKKALMEFRGKLYDEVKKYRDMDPSQVLTLFNGEVVPSKDDMNKLKSIMNQMLADDGMSGFWDDLIPDGVLGVSDIDRIRNKLVEVSYSPPDNPPGGTATRSQGAVQRPVSIVANNDNSYDTTINVIWTPSEYLGAGWSVRLGPSMDTDLNYYKFFHEQIRYYSNKPLYMLSEVYLKAEQIQNGTIYVPDTGAVDSERMWYTPHDMNGRTSPNVGGVSMDRSHTIGTPQLSVSVYQVQYQQKTWSAIKSDPNGTWYDVYWGGGTSFTHTVSAEASYWYRVRAQDSWGNWTDWTYTTDITYIKY